MFISILLEAVSNGIAVFLSTFVTKNIRIHVNTNSFYPVKHTLHKCDILRILYCKQLVTVSNRNRFISHIKLSTYVLGSIKLYSDQ